MPSPPTVQPAVAQDQDEKPLSVQLASGRTFTGKLDSRTNPTQLWLRSQRGSAVTLRPIRWDRVVRVRVAGEDLSGEEFHGIVKAVKRDAPGPKQTAAARNRIVIKGSTRSGGFASATSTTPRKVRKTPRVGSLAIEAVVANWDADVEVDGLLVHVYPLDDTGAAVPARGMLQFDLTVQRTGVATCRRPFTRLGRWARQVRVEDFGVDGAVYRLPFQSVHPEFDLEVAPHGALHARLSVPGQGTFETTESMVRIRPYSAVRDQFQQATGRRFFPQERTGRGRR